MENWGFATKQIHAEKIPNAFGALCSPIYQSTTFQFKTFQEGVNRFMGKDKGYVYTRGRNPSSEEIEKRVANLEHGEACCVTASGIGAISSTMWTLLKAGDELVASDTLYGCTYAYFARGLTRFGVKVTFKDFTKLDELKAALTDKTAIVYFESPCNPTLKIINIESIAKIVHEYKKNIKVVVDNTFPSPYLSQPLTLGAELSFTQVQNILMDMGMLYVVLLSLHKIL